MAKEQCIQCGYTGDYIPFCRYCGRENKDFDPENFEIEYGCTIEEMRARDCSMEHEGLITEIREPIENFGDLDQVVYLKESPFCEYCGARIELSLQVKAVIRIHGKEIIIERNI